MTSKHKYGRSGGRRSGDDYQDVVALETIVDFLEDKNRYLYIRVEAPDKGSLDDVVAVRKDGSYELKQVKFSGYPDEEWTWGDLLKAEKGCKSLIQKWASSFERIKQEGTIYSASLETNRKSKEIERAFGLNNHVSLEKISNKATRDSIIQQIGDEGRAEDFFRGFCFNIKRQNLDTLEETILRRFLRLGLTIDDWNNLKNELKKWARETNQPQPDGLITYEVILKAVRWHELKTLDESFPVPRDFVVPSEEFHEMLLTRLKGLESGCIVIAASPGMGKSTYLSYLYAQLDLLKIPAIRHHYYISDEDQTFGRTNPQNIAESLMGEIKSKYSDFLGKLQDKNVSFRDFKLWLNGCGESFRKKDKSLVLIIDGLDHAWRERQSIDEMATLLEHILPTPKGIVVIIGTQPLSNQKIPPSLLKSAPRSSWLFLPPLDLKAMRKWIECHEDKMSLPQEKEMRNNIMNRCAETLQRKSGGLPLYLHYALKKIEEQQLELNIASIESLLECPHNDIVEYYRLLIQSLQEEEKQILFLLATSPFPWSASGIVECLGSIPSPQIIKALNDTKFLMEENFGYLSLFHNSLDVFLNDQPEYPIYSKRLNPLIVDWLDKEAPEHIKLQFLWLMKAKAGDENPLLFEPTRKWVVNAISKSIPKRGISRILFESAKLALHKKNIKRFIEISFLIDYYDRVYDWQKEATNNLFFANLLNNKEMISISSFTNLGDLEHEQLLYLSEQCRDNPVLLKYFFTELDERRKGNRISDIYQEEYTRTLSLHKSFIEAAALNIETKLQTFLERLVKAENNGIPNAVEIFCNALWKNKESYRLRELLKLQMPNKDFSTVLKYAILLSYEEGFDLSIEVASNLTNPFAVIYAATHGLNTRDLLPIEFPPLTLVDLTDNQLYSSEDKLTHVLYDLFFVLVANFITKNSGKNEEWIAQIHHWWPRGLISLLNETAKELSQLISKQGSFSIDLPYYITNRLKRLTWIEDRSFAMYGACAGNAINKISLDLFAIMRTEKLKIGKNELKSVFSTQYGNSWDWINLLLDIKRDWLSQECLDWLELEMETRINATIRPFSERAVNYSQLSALFALHNSSNNSKVFAGKAAENLLSYSNHKDITFFLVLDALELCYQSNADSMTKWLLQILPAIMWIEEYTDGDETKYLPREIGEIISKHEQNFVASHYAWLLEQQDYHNARELVVSFLKFADMRDPINQAIARTAIDEESLLLLHKSAKLDKNARSTLSKIIRFLGKNTISNIENKKKAEEYKNSNSYGHIEKSLPDPALYPPEKFSEYLGAIKSQAFYSNNISEWIKFWIKTPQMTKAYDSVSQALERGITLDEYDSFFDLAFSAAVKKKLTLGW